MDGNLKAVDVISSFPNVDPLCTEYVTVHKNQKVHMLLS